MIANILEALSSWIVHVISTLGYPGVVLLMAIESACIPLPSEIIMPFAGAATLVAVAEAHRAEPMSLWLVGLAGALGCNLGSVVAYFVGARLGRPFLERTRWVHFFVTPHELERVDHWFDRRGPIVVFVARLLPVVRTFIALPAGIARMNQIKFHVYTFAGSLPWCLALAALGQQMGEHWEGECTVADGVKHCEGGLRPWFHRFDFVIGLLIVAGAVWFVRSRMIALREHAVRTDKSAPG